MPDASGSIRRYESYEQFLKSALEAYWTTRKNQANFVALLLASREAWAVAWDGIRSPSTGSKLMTGAASISAVLLVLRMFLGGPIGLLVTGVSLAGLSAVYVRNHKDIWSRQERYRRLLSEYRAHYDQVRADWIEGRIDEAQSALMFDGLLNRMLDEIDRA